MKPPIFPIHTGGSQAQQYFRRGMQFHDAGMPLVSYINSEPNWPRIALVTHAIELALKAFVFQAIESGVHSWSKKQPGNHDLEGWYSLAVDFGLPGNDELARNIEALNGLHEPHLARYPNLPKSPLPDPATIPDGVVEYHFQVCMPVIFPR